MGVEINTVRFGKIIISQGEKINFPEGLLGFSQYTDFCLVDPQDDTLILWLQSIQEPSLAFPVLEPKIFYPSYIVRLSALELRQLQLSNINESVVFSVITIPSDVTQMTANLKAPLAVNLKNQIGRQVVLQENEYSIRFEMFKELRAHLMTIQAQNKPTGTKEQTAGQCSPVLIQDISPSNLVRPLNA